MVGLQHDYYCFGLTEGTSLTVKRITVLSPKRKVTMLLYGDSITEPEGYFPTADFPGSWTQLIIKHLKGSAISSGRGGRSEEHTSELQPLMRISYAVFCLKKNKKTYKSSC